MMKKIMLITNVTAVIWKFRTHDHVLRQDRKKKGMREGKQERTTQYGVNILSIKIPVAAPQLHYVPNVVLLNSRDIQAVITS
jgi:hypothetical protein